MNSETCLVRRFTTDTYSGKPTKKMERSPSFFKLLLYTLFDNSPATALKFLETPHDALKGLPAQSLPRKDSSNLHRNQLPLSASVQHYIEADSKSVEYDGGQHSTSRSHSFPRYQLSTLFKRKRSSRAKIDANVTNSVAGQDSHYNGSISSSSMFEIDIHSEEDSSLDPQVRRVVGRLESEISELKIQLESKEEEFKKLKDEVSSLRSSSASSESASPRSDRRSSNASPGSDKFQGFVGIKAPSETSDQHDDDLQTHTYMYFGPSNGSFLKLDERSRLSCSTSHVLDEDIYSLRGENVGEYSEMLQSHMNTFLDDAAAVIDKCETLDQYTHIQPYETQGQGNHYFMEKDPSLELVSNISEEVDDIEDDPLENVQVDVFSKESILGHMEVEKCVSCEAVEPEEYHWFSQESKNKKEGSKLSIMDYGVPADPEIAENRRRVKLRHQEVEEKLMKSLRIPRRDNLSRSYRSTSSSSSETSSPTSVENGLSEDSFTEDEQRAFRMEEFKSDDLNRNYSLVPPIKSYVEVSRVPFRRDRLNLELELSSPIDILHRKFGSLPEDICSRQAPRRIDPTKQTILSRNKEICGDICATTIVEEPGKGPTKVSNIFMGNYDDDILIGRIQRYRHGISRFGEEAARLTNQRQGKLAIQRQRSFAQVDFNHDYRV